MNTLFTFLGRGRDDPGTGYRRATYRFPDGRQVTTALFGLELANYLGVDELVILGTKGSQWGVLVEAVASDGEEEELRIDLMDAEANGTVDENLLGRCAPLMSRATGRIARPHLIPFGRNERDQVDILRVVEHSATRGGVHIDVTHGFRHLGMVGFLSAFMLEKLRSNLIVHGLWYGALDMQEDGIAPVVRLDGLEHVRRWVDALDRYDATGDYGVFAPLLVKDGVPPDRARCLEDASYYERVMNLSDAARRLGTFLPVLEEPLQGASALFRQRLLERLRWTGGADIGEHQRKLAFQNLKRQDYLRAVVFGWEALVTRECIGRSLPTDDHIKGREPAIKALEGEIDEDEHPQWKADAFRTLRAVRNALAHGSPPYRRGHRQLLRDSTRLGAELERVFQQLL